MKEPVIFSAMSDEEVRRFLRENKIGLTVLEARKIEQILGRPPTLTETVIFGIQGSEHSSYKSSRKHLAMFPSSAPNVILGPSEDAGIVELLRLENGDRIGIVLSHESHNHPSQVVPYEGAATGVGGNVRDVACMGARVIATLDPLRFGEISRNESRRIADGVVAGIAGYGNPLGIPNLGGDTYFDPSYNHNCLVNVVTLGIVRESEILHSYVPAEAADEGYEFILVGKPTDNSGMGGAAFASFGLDQLDRESAKGAVQEPNPFLKRHLLVSTYALFEKLKKKNLLKKVGFKDLGAGGVMCATVEMVNKQNFGAEIDLDRVHQSMKNLHPSVIACGETQERFMWACHPSLTKMILAHYNKKWDLPSVAEGAKASVIGKVTRGDYVLVSKSETYCSAPAKTICEGLQYDRPYALPERTMKEPIIPSSNLAEILKRLLASENIACRKSIYERYDKNVQGFTVIESGEADAGVMQPLIDMKDVPKKLRQTGFAVSVDGNPRYGLIDPYWQGVNATVESMRNVAAVGAYPIALTDCLNYGNPEKAEQMGEFVEGVRGIADSAKHIHLKEFSGSPTPIISGNVSLYNETGGSPIAPSPTVCCIGKIDSVKQAITMQFKKTGSLIFLVGARKNELGGSEYYRLFAELGAKVPKPDFTEAEKEIFAVTDAIAEKSVFAAHDISEGGLAVTLAEMCFGGRGDGKIGCSIDLLKISEMELQPEQKLFSETGGFVLEIKLRRKKLFLEICQKYGLTPYEIGRTITEPKYVVKEGRKVLIESDLVELSERWLNGLREKW